MAHSNKSKGKGQHKHAQHDSQQDDDVVEHSAAVLTCATDAADEFVEVCEHYLEDLEVDLPYLRVALEIWAEHPELAQSLRNTLGELLQALSGHCQALKDIRQTLVRLAADPGPPTHLEPLERYRRLIRERLFPATPAA
jgi:hypothetical protein